jgi:hypothetical protein
VRGQTSSGSARGFAQQGVFFEKKEGGKRVEKSRKTPYMDAKGEDSSTNCPENRTGGIPNDTDKAPDFPEESLFEKRSLSDILTLYLKSAEHCKKRKRHRCISSELK